MAIEIAFLSKSLRAICTSEIVAQEKLNANVARKLKARLADLRAANSVNDLIAGNPRELEGNYPSRFAVDLCDGYHLIFCSNHNSTPLAGADMVDWSKVSRIKILNIGALT